MKTSSWMLAGHALAMAVPILLAAAAWTASNRSPFRSALLATRVSVAMALASAALAIAGATDGAQATTSRLPVRLDGVTVVMLLLVTTLGLVSVRYSRTYLAGDRGQKRYARWLLVTLSAVTSLVIANNLLLIAAAWTATSLALHQLLTFYRDRATALVAAHKKFLVSRLADACLWSALALIYRAVGTLDLDALDAWVEARHELPLSMEVAAALCVIAACLKSAQLPFHGWLTQVMEAPTPVSALLHAGVVNLGGFLMIRLAALMTLAPAAQLLLVVIAITTTCIAALVMTTRVSIKVALAWSTCAQMGFMLVECGLGLFELALLHLVAHSLYKAHAFLGAGSAVEVWRQQAAARRPEPVMAGRFALVLGVLIAAAVGLMWLRSALVPKVSSSQPATVVLGFMVALSFVPMMARGANVFAAVALRAAAVAALYAVLHVVAVHVGPVTSGHGWTAAWVVVVASLAALFAVHAVLWLKPHGVVARSLHPWLFAGLYLDERFTRLTFRIWPPRRPGTSLSAGIAMPDEVLP